MIESLARSRNNGNNGISEFVKANFWEPWNPFSPTWQAQPNWGQMPGMGHTGDFVLANFPEPHNPFGMSGCGCGGSCSACGMGQVAVPSWAASLPSPLNQIWGPLPVVYWGIGGMAALLILPAVMGGRRRR